MPKKMTIIEKEEIVCPEIRDISNFISANCPHLYDRLMSMVVELSASQFQRGIIRGAELTTGEDMMGISLKIQEETQFDA